MRTGVTNQPWAASGGLTPGRTRRVRRRSGGAVLGSYALGGGRSGAEPGVAGIVTVSANSRLSDKVPGNATPAAGAAPSAVTHGMQVMDDAQLLCDGFEHDASFGAVTVVAAAPGVVHTTPTVPIVR